MNELSPIRLSPPDDAVRFDRALIERMDDAGILEHLDRWELVDGFFVDASDPPRPYPHEDASRWRYFIGNEPIIPLDRTVVEKLREAGILADLGRCELEDGVLVRMLPSVLPHGLALLHFSALLILRFGERAMLAGDTTLYLTDGRMRAPDIAVVPNDTASRALAPDDLLLCVEISDNSLEKDLEEKAGEYAESGIPEYWGIDLPNRLIHIHREPHSNGYRSVVAQKWNVPVHPLCAPDVEIIPAEQLDRVIK